MKLQQMFPKETLDAEDLFALCPNGAVVTIEKMDFKTYESNQIGDAEISYFLFTEEFKKPFRLNKTNAYTIGELLGSDDTDDWTGRHITVHGVRKKITDRDTGKPKQVWVIDVDMVAPRSKPTLPRKQDITGLGAGNRFGRPAMGQGAQRPALGVSGLIGVDRAVDIVSALVERGRVVEDLAKHIENIGMGDQVAGRPLPEWSEALIPVARKFCQGFPKTHAKPTPGEIERIRAAWAPPPEVINRGTGEVLTGQGQQFEEIQDDDIPF